MKCTPPPAARRVGGVALGAGGPADRLARGHRAVIAHSCIFFIDNPD
jgi:hypothetical protein